MQKDHTGKNKNKNKSLVYQVEEEAELLKFLLQVLSNRSRNSVKSILARGQVTIDDHIETQYNYQLRPGQKVAILKNKAAVEAHQLVGMEIIYEDDAIIIINKSAGLLSIGTNKERNRTAHHQLMEYVRLEDPENRIFVVHRLDKDTSGVMMFAKSERVKRILQDSWKKIVKERTYMALVNGRVEKTNGVMKSWLRETKTHMMYSSFKPGDGLLAITHFRTIRSNENFSLLELQLETGRKNQIRVHMKDMEHPLAGDKKYGSKENPIGRLGLHAKALVFEHPITGELLRFEAPAPSSFFSKTRESNG